MDGIINIGTFIGQLTSYIKICTYANKGTSHDAVLGKCIRLYNKYKIIESLTELSPTDEIFVRKSLKRFNLILKVDTNGNPIDIRNKENQLKLIFLKEHPSLVTDNIEEMIAYSSKNEIDILVGIPLNFFLTENKYSELLWNYTRLLFYISQMLVSKINPDADKTSKSNVIKQSVFDTASDKIEEILSNIAKMEDDIKINQLMSLDNFLNNKLVKSGITKTNVNDAKQEVKEIFAKKGLGDNNSMTKMIDSISDKLANIDLSNGNIMQCMFGIAQNVAEELRGDLESNPEGFQNAIGAITEVFQDAMDNSSKNGEEIPTEIKGMMGTIMNINGVAGNLTNGNQNGKSNESLDEELSNIAARYGMDTTGFIKSISDDAGEIDANKLEKILANMDMNH